jgi:hypothetical protein
MDIETLHGYFLEFYRQAQKEYYGKSDLAWQAYKAGYGLAQRVPDDVDIIGCRTCEYGKLAQTDQPCSDCFLDMSGYPKYKRAK